MISRWGSFFSFIQSLSPVRSSGSDWAKACAPDCYGRGHAIASCRDDGDAKQDEESAKQPVDGPVPCGEQQTDDDEDRDCEGAQPAHLWTQLVPGVPVSTGCPARTTADRTIGVMRSRHDRSLTQAGDALVPPLHFASCHVPGPVTLPSARTCRGCTRRGPRSPTYALLDGPTHQRSRWLWRSPRSASRRARARSADCGNHFHRRRALAAPRRRRPSSAPGQTQEPGRHPCGPRPQSFLSRTRVSR